MGERKFHALIISEHISIDCQYIHIRHYLRINAHYIERVLLLIYRHEINFIY